MNLTNVMKVADTEVRKLLLKDWENDQAWKRDMEMRMEQLEKRIQPTNAIGFSISPHKTSMGNMFPKHKFRGGD